MTKFSDLTAAEHSQLLQAARAAEKHAYAPYSKFRVGAAVLTEKGNMYSGCNVENASYGLTICAERAAIFSAVAKEGGDNMKIRALAIVCKNDVPCPPCGACRQVILEFGPSAIIIFKGKEGLKKIPATKLMPEAFNLL